MNNTFSFTSLGSLRYSMMLSSRTRVRIQRRRVPGAIMKSLAESFPLLGRQLFPALGHSLAHSLAYSPLRSPTRIALPTATETKASKQNPAESQQAESLPESDLP